MPCQTRAFRETRGIIRIRILNQVVVFRLRVEQGITGLWKDAAGAAVCDNYFPDYFCMDSNPNRDHLPSTAAFPRTGKPAGRPKDAPVRGAQGSFGQVGQGPFREGSADMLALIRQLLLFHFP